MIVKINNFKGIKNAEIELRNITIIGGDNGAGKTSIAQGIAAALTGECPVKDLKKTDYRNLVNFGTGSALCQMISDDGTSGSKMTFPDGSVFSNGTCRSSMFSTGISSPLDLSKNDAVDCWVSILKSEPTLDDLRDELKGNPHCDEVVALVKALNFDGALKQISEDGSKRKGRWEKITGERYGTKKADTWKPANFVFGVEKSDLEARLQKAQEDYNESLKKTAIDDHEHQRLTALSAQIPTLTERLNDINTTIARLEKDCIEHKATLDEALAAENILTCPHCNKDVIFQHGKLEPTEKKQASDIPLLQKQYTGYLTEISSLKGSLKETELLLTQAEAASKMLSAVVVGEKPTGFLEALQKAKDELKAYADYHDAQAEQAEVMWRIDVHRILAPDGLRKKKTDDKIKAFNQQLLQICQSARWSVVAIDPDFNVTYDNRIYQVLSESEQYRVRSTIQIAIAISDNSDVLIFDRVDLLTKTGRNGLLRVCKSLSCKSVILLSANTLQDIPQLNSDGEISYWVANGEVS